ncbi:uncharacterized protein LOC34623691 [Cyclospora cayetanensis]|uniref:Uncharacterized protein LOC34623691 n=1 Tax=Cyclospora cayetanensis TaxID=88456 RepID=A0A6P6RW39_9EIME|nr:uncharacterized protein LOC34623691 [Cyclospora cayetanensis]
MVRTGGDAADFVYGLSLSSLQPPEQAEEDEDTPLRFISVQLHLPEPSKGFDIDIHAFLFEVDGTYVDCVFYKNPQLAGKSVRILQQEQELLVDLRYVPKRCSFIVCTLAIYSGGTVAQLGESTVQLSALVPRMDVGEGMESPHIPCGQIPPSSSDFYEWVCLGVLPLKARNMHGEECSMMLCLLSHHGGYWYFKPVLKPVSAFTPQGLIEPAQEYVVRHAAGLNEGRCGMELGALLNAGRQGVRVEFELTDTEESAIAEAAGAKELRASDVKSWAGGSGVPSEAEGEGQRWLPLKERGEALGARAQRIDGRITKADGERRKLSMAVVGKDAASRKMRARRRASSEDGFADLAGGLGDKGDRKGDLPMKYVNVGEEPMGEDSFGKGSRGEESTLKRGGVRYRKSSQDTQLDLTRKVPCDEPSGSPTRGRNGGPRQGTSTAPEGEQERARNLRWKSRTNYQWARERAENFSKAAKLTGPKSNLVFLWLCTYRGGIKAESLFASYPPEGGYHAGELHRVNADGEQELESAAAHGCPCTGAWKESVDRRLESLERAVESMSADIHTVAAATSEMQNNNKLYIQELRDKFIELKNDVATDIESAVARPLKGVHLRLEKLEANESADAKQLAEQQKKLWEVDRMVTLAERNWHLVSQSLSELRIQLAGFEQRIVQGPFSPGPTVPATDQEKGLPVSLQPTTCISNQKLHEAGFFEVLGNTLAGQASDTEGQDSTKAQGHSEFASKALAELGRMQDHAAAFGACLRQLASGTAPDGLKGLNPIERRVLSFAGTPKVFSALHELERAIDAINLHGTGASGTRLY